MLKRILYTLHRVLGTILSIMFLVWFLSGFVMIYHTFPKVSNKDKFAYMDVLPMNVNPIDSVLNDSAVVKLSLRSVANSPYFEVSTDEGSSKIQAGYTALPSVLSFSQIEGYAKRWNKSEIIKVDTLRKLEQWIPFGTLKKDFPIYKFYFGDEEKHQLYISSVTGDALQFTDKDQRFWSWLGPIPHWVYFTSLRQNSKMWVDVVVILSAIGCIVCLSGIIVGIRSYIVQYRKKKKFGTPYKRFPYKWHHILGFIFGIFVLTFVFSGMMSLADIPQWLVKTHNTEIRANQSVPDAIFMKDYKLDFHKILTEYPDQVKSIEWTSFGNIPLYKVIVGDKQLVFDASDENIRFLDITSQMITDKLSKIHKEPISINEIYEYDNYYVGTSNHLPLPVYKVSVDNADNSTYYINPKNGNTKYYDNNSKAHRWTYKALHSFEIGFLVRYPILWNIVMWSTMIGGTLVSITGVWLGFKYLGRKIKKFKKYLCSSQKR